MGSYTTTKSLTLIYKYLGLFSSLCFIFVSSINMGESTCLMHTLAFGMPNEPNNHGNNAHILGDSVSLGRFASESLAWEKWSVFPHKRYVEEAKSYAQPGSVAQKKAFFEAHYKKVAAQKAAADAAAATLLQQEKAKSQVEERVCGTNHSAYDSEATTVLKATSTEPTTGVKTSHDLQTMVLSTHKRQPAALNSKMAANEEHRIISQDVSKASDAVNVLQFGSEKMVISAVPKNQDLSNNTENLEDGVSVSEDSRTSQMERPLLKSKLNTDQEVLQPKIRRKPATPSFRSTSIGWKQSRIPPSPSKYVASMHPRKENLVTPRTKNPTTIDSADKNRTAPRSLYTLMNSGSVKESSKLNSPAVRKTETTKPALLSARSTPKRPIPMTTPSKVTDGVNKQDLGTPTVKRRMEKQTPVHPSASAAGSKTPGQKWQIFSAVSKSLSAYRNKLKSATVSSPFTLRTEERAAQRKQKLEEKFNEKAAQKVQLQTTLKEKAETEFKRFRQSFCFKARPLPNFYTEKHAPKSPIKKTPLLNAKSSVTSARKPPTKISQPPSAKKSSSRRLWKTNDENAATTHPLSLLAKRTGHENVSPNIHN